ncbi:hypothetical protein ATANTOWER_000143 [Ataeniobius toweri]|uniref:Uncharacterized protein n=1 Tax=Ataeniobius toweri TaxID=208326 RepID=A0ABU7CDN4_9TELE|nr:hypothetical protein [Ataeniobius toweri]
MLVLVDPAGGRQPEMLVLVDPAGGRQPEMLVLVDSAGGRQPEMLVLVDSAGGRQPETDPTPTGLTGPTGPAGRKQQNNEAGVETRLEHKLFLGLELPCSPSCEVTPGPEPRRK